MTTPSPLLIRNAMVIASADSDDVLPRADILVADGRIAAVGAIAETPAAAGARVIEADGYLAMSGLVNAHMHSQSATMAGFGDRLSHPAFMWLTQAHTSRRTADEIRLAVLLTATQMLLSGTTAVVDHFPGQRFSVADIDAVMGAWSESGMRAMLGLRFFDAAFDDIFPVGATLEPSLAARAADVLQPHPLSALREQIPEIVSRWHKADGRLSVCPAPSNPDRCTDDALIYCAEVAAQHDVCIHTHLLETRAQARLASERYGMTALAHLEALGVLSSRWSCAHSIWLSDSDIDIMAQRGAVAVHCPESNARLGTGCMRTPAMMAAGVRIALGTDGAGANDNLLMHEAMRAAATLHRADIPTRGNWISAHDALRMATEGGAAAMCLGGKIGRIAPGYCADIALYRLDAPWWLPVNEAVPQMVFAETGASVDLVMIGGRIVVEHGRITAFDADAVKAEVRSIATHMRRRNADLFAVAEAMARTFP